MTFLASSFQPARDQALPGFEHISRHYRTAEGRVWAKIFPGELYATRLDEEIVTVLGSCVSVCMRDPVAGIGGMNHYMLPEPGGEPGRSTRYGIHAMEDLISALERWGGRRERFEVKVTGGGNIGLEGCGVARQNIAFAEKFLARLGIVPMAIEVGGPYPRKVRFHPLSGKLRVRRLPAIEAVDHDTIHQLNLDEGA